MTFGQSISTCFGKYATFTGRASRSEFWWFYLAYVIVASAANFIDQVVLDQRFGVISIVVVLLFLLPIVSAGVRRLHDSGKSGWLLLLFFIPCIGWIVLIVLLAQATQPGENAYGPQSIA